MTYRLELELPGLPKTPNIRMHWRTRHAENQKWAMLIRQAIGRRRPKQPLQHAKLTLTRCSSTPTDFDNLVSSFKPVTDALISAGVLKDDSMAVIGMPEFQHEKAARGKGGIRILVVDLVVDDAQAIKSYGASP